MCPRWSSLRFNNLPGLWTQFQLLMKWLHNIWRVSLVLQVLLIPSTWKLMTEVGDCYRLKMDSITKMSVAEVNFNSSMLILAFAFFQLTGVWGEWKQGDSLNQLNVYNVRISVCCVHLFVLVLTPRLLWPIDSSPKGGGSRDVPYKCSLHQTR